MTWRQLLALIAGVLLIVAAGAAMAQGGFACFAIPAGAPPPNATFYYGALSDQLLEGLARREDVTALPGPGQWMDVFNGLAVESRGLDTVVVLLRGAQACPIMVPRGAWEAVKRTVLGEVV